MPTERRDYNSKAKLFVPTRDERDARAKVRILDEKIAEVDSLKEEMLKMMKEVKDSQ